MTEEGVLKIKRRVLALHRRTLAKLEKRQKADAERIPNLRWRIAELEKEIRELEK